MIISENPNPSLSEFKNLMSRTDDYLNNEAKKRPDYYPTRGGTDLEDDVLEALEYNAKGTDFDGTIEKISGQAFPDIVASNLYGVEVKSTTQDRWTSAGGSIKESTRVSGVKRIYLTFGKLGGQVEFLSRPYEECLSEIAVTHSPRYQINMKLTQGQTIFDKMGIGYDELRIMDNPVEPVASYYRQHLKPGESLWWTGNRDDDPVSLKVRLWKTLSQEEKANCIAYGLLNYPEILNGEYDGYLLWLTTQGIVDGHVRDQFSAGGRVKMQSSDMKTIECPAVYKQIENSIPRMIELLSESSAGDTTVLLQQMFKWCDMASKYSSVDSEVAQSVFLNMLIEHLTLKEK